MQKDQFSIDVHGLGWISGCDDDPHDLCLHGTVSVRIGDELVADRYECTVSAFALHLLKSLDEDYRPHERPNRMLPCCGNDFHVWGNTAIVLGCPNGIDWSVLHAGSVVRLATEATEVQMPLDDYRKVVFDFVDKVEAYYKACQPKQLWEDDRVEREGYIMFWKEWNGRRHGGYK